MAALFAFRSPWGLASWPFWAMVHPVVARERAMREARTLGSWVLGLFLAIMLFWVALGAGLLRWFFY